MIGQITSLLNPLVGAGLSMAGLNKINPKFARFFAGALGADYTASQAVDYLRSKFENPAIAGEKERLEQGARSGSLRPDEMASAVRQRQTETIPRAIGALGKGAALIGGGLALQPGQEPQQGLLSPELQSFLEGRISQGIPFQAAAKLAQGHPQFRDEIADLEEKSGKSFLDFIMELFGQGQQQSQQGAGQQQGQNSGDDAAIIEAMQKIFKM